MSGGGRLQTNDSIWFCWKADESVTGEGQFVSGGRDGSLTSGFYSTENERVKGRDKPAVRFQGFVPSVSLFVMI